MDVFESVIRDFRKSGKINCEDIEAAIEELVKAKTNMPDNHTQFRAGSKNNIGSTVSFQKLVPTPIEALFTKARLLTWKEYRRLKASIQPVYAMWMILNDDYCGHDYLAAIISNGSIAGNWAERNTYLRPVLEYCENGHKPELFTGDRVCVGKHTFTVITPGLALSDMCVGKVAGNKLEIVQTQLDKWFDSINDK